MKQKHGSKQKPEANSKVRLAVVGALAVAAAGAVVVLGMSIYETPAASVSGQPAAFGAPSTGGEVPAPPGITNPTPYQYDVATNRHYDPDHAHWHAGPPPGQGQRGASTGVEVPAPPGITNPSAYQYHAATDRHYDPVHAHWHSGPPPR